MSQNNKKIRATNSGYRYDQFHRFIKRYTSYSVLYPLSFIREGKVKRWIRKRILKVFNSVPIFFVLNEGDCAIQVGTPHARTMKRFSRYVGSSGKVYIIEADKDNYEVLANAKQKYQLANVELIRSAAWREKSALTFYRSKSWVGDHKIPVDGVVVDNDFISDYEPYKVQANTLDNLLAERNVYEFNYMCVTVNGAELEVLKGAKALMQNSKDCRIFSKGHSLKEGVPLNKYIADYIKSFEGFKVVISKGEASHPGIENWERRAGDVFAWKIKS